jgi:hypothetical protein
VTPEPVKASIRTAPTPPANPVLAIMEGGPHDRDGLRVTDPPPRMLYALVVPRLGLTPNLGECTWRTAVYTLRQADRAPTGPVEGPDIGQPTVVARYRFTGYLEGDGR